MTDDPPFHEGLEAAGDLLGVEQRKTNQGVDVGALGHGEHLEQVARLRLQLFQAREDRLVPRPGRQLIGRYPASDALPKEARILERPQGLEKPARVPAAPMPDRRKGVVGQGALAQETRDQLTAILFGERADRKPVDPRIPEGAQIRLPGRGDQHHRGLEVRGKVAEQGDAGRVGPLEVIQCQDQGPISSGLAKPRLDTAEQPAPLESRLELLRRFDVQIGEEPGQVRRHLRRRPTQEVRGVVQQLAEGRERGERPIQATVAGRAGLAGERRKELDQQARLAQTRLPGEHRRACAILEGRLCRHLQQVQRRITSHERNSGGIACYGHLREVVGNPSW